MTRKRTAEWNEKISRALTGQPKTDAHKHAIRDSWYSDTRLSKFEQNGTKWPSTAVRVLECLWCNAPFIAKPSTRKSYCDAHRSVAVRRKEWVSLIGQCMICSTTEDLVLDHVHGTKQVRGALCQAHNNGLGFFQDSPQLLRAAADYLEKYWWSQDSLLADLVFEPVTRGKIHAASINDATTKREGSQYANKIVD